MNNFTNLEKSDQEILDRAKKKLDESKRTLEEAETCLDLERAEELQMKACVLASTEKKVLSMRLYSLYSLAYETDDDTLEFSKRYKACTIPYQTLVKEIESFLEDVVESGGPQMTEAMKDLSHDQGWSKKF